MKKLILLILLAVAVGLVLYFEPGRLFTLESLQSRRELLSVRVREFPVLSGVIFLLAYVAATALSFPGATILTLAGGALFGFVYGTVLVSFASTIGATLAFLFSRYLLRDFVEKRFSKAFGKINRGIESEGVNYLIFLRVTPLFPFFLVNLLLGITRLPARTFYWGSQLGMLPSTLIYVNAGTQLATIHSLRDILSFRMLFALSLLGVFPIAVKRFAGFLLRRRKARESL